VVRTFTDPGDLGGAVLHALAQLGTRRPAPAGGAAPPGGRPWMAPAPSGPVVDRPELAGAPAPALSPRAGVRKGEGGEAGRFGRLDAE
jgi:hypothetical protein